MAREKMSMEEWKARAAVDIVQARAELVELMASTSPEGARPGEGLRELARWWRKYLPTCGHKMLARLFLAEVD